VTYFERLKAVARSAASLYADLQWTIRSPLSRRTRIAIAVAQIRGGWSQRPKYFQVPFGSSTLLLDQQTLYIDVQTIRGVLAGEYFDSNFAGRVVIDGGAHKGYYAVRALERGAQAVYSYEPEMSNYQALSLTRDMTPRANCWRTERVALSDAEGRVVLNVSDESWAHSLLVPASGDVTSTQEVGTRALSSILDEVREGHPTRELIVKLNIEGAAGTVLLATDPSDWEQVVELWCEFEVNEPCPRERIEEHLSAAGFMPAEHVGQTLARFHR
jgi:FkbM family methyltransferase